MTVPTDTIWPLDPHGRAKHAILERYLKAWFMILTRGGFKRVLYLDGFAGPGRYSGGEPGSPLIAIEVARRSQPPLTARVHFRFFEKDPNRCNSLKSEVGKLQLPSHFDVKEPECGEFRDLAPALIQRIRSFGQTVPTFAFIDPFGFSGIPYTIISDLLALPSCEAFITFNSQGVNRFLTEESPGKRATIVETFGTNEVIALLDHAAREQKVRDLYQAQLLKVGRFVRYFEMRDRKNQVVYQLFFATNSREGHIEMKKAMWRADPLGEFSFSDFTDRNRQIVLGLDLWPPQLREMIRSEFVGKGQIDVECVCDWVEDETIFLDKHMKSVLIDEESRGGLRVEALKTGGARRVKGTFPDGVIIELI